MMYKHSGYLDVGAEFTTHAEACNFFGHSYKQWYKAVAPHPAQSELVLWFPRFYENDEWQTWISDDQGTIYERRIADNDAYVDECLDRPGMFKRLVFPALRPGRYCFKGLYEIDPRISRSNSVITYLRRATRVKTYASIS